ncbi:hypothetical protein FHR53_002771 [Xanthomonas arboricola]
MLQDDRQGSRLSRWPTSALDTHTGRIPTDKAPWRHPCRQGSRDGGRARTSGDGRCAKLSTTASRDALLALKQNRQPTVWRGVLTDCGTVWRHGCRHRAPMDGLTACPASGEDTTPSTRREDRQALATRTMRASLLDCSIPRAVRAAPSTRLEYRQAIAIRAIRAMQSSLPGTSLPDGHRTVLVHYCTKAGNGKMQAALRGRWKSHRPPAQTDCFSITCDAVTPW